MGPGEIITFFLIVVGLPVTLGVGSHIYKERLKFKTKELEILGNETAEKAAQYAAHNERLEQRVRVLERIVTDKGVDLPSRLKICAISQIQRN